MAMRYLSVSRSNGLVHDDGRGGKTRHTQAFGVKAWAAATLSSQPGNPLVDQPPVVAQTGLAVFRLSRRIRTTPAACMESGNPLLINIVGFSTYPSNDEPTPGKPPHALGARLAERKN
jgi:hypothetical protein